MKQSQSILSCCGSLVLVGFFLLFYFLGQDTLSILKSSWQRVFNTKCNATLLTGYVHTIEWCVFGIL